MLQLQNITKRYVTGELVQMALDSVNLTLRDNEFVAVLGPSGSGKTTLLNIVGGLDRYDSGDLVINGISTRKYNDRDWDSYRNHTIGFVFQTYNLIPHQSILANVELALTIGGVSRQERKRRARAALEQVGLADQAHKRPNQMSGGQMQRVAIARALVNNPDVLLADEPTGALDSETSIQVLDLLKEVAKDRLVVMVTHNAELAERYATRIVKLRDGRIVGDSAPCEPSKEQPEAPAHKNMGKASMSFGTSLSLSFNNLRTKLGRTLLTSFAGSIGIIGIALILSLSTGVNDYIDNVQKDTMSSYPVTISASSYDLSGFTEIGEVIGGRFEETLDREGVYSDNSSLKANAALELSLIENDLTAFKKYLDDKNSEIHKYLGENGVIYSYEVKFSAYSYDVNGALVSTDARYSLSGSTPGMGGFGGFPSMITDYMSSGAAANFSELMRGSGDDMVSAVTTDSYDVLYGRWPEAYDEIIVVLYRNNSIPTEVLFQLGLITAEEFNGIAKSIKDGGETDELKWEYSDVCGRVYYIVPASDVYAENPSGTFSTLSAPNVDAAIPIKVVGVVRPKEGAANANIHGAVGYPSALTDYIIGHTAKSPVVTAQQAQPAVNILTGIPFEAADDAAKAADAKKYVSTLNTSSKATLYRRLFGTTAPLPDESSMAAAIDSWLETAADEATLVTVYNSYVAGATYDDNLSSFGVVSYDAPASINIYTDSFEDKEAIAVCIENYNKTAPEGQEITYTDYVALLTSSLTSIVNVISYVLIAFVAVSLVVSCIMIGIITHISVLERTKEIGILRAVGASKRNISQVFNAETFIIGICSGVLGVAISMFLTIPINALMAFLLGDQSLNANLPILYGALLVAISVVITVFGGLIPAKKASKKDPVIALRTE